MNRLCSWSTCNAWTHGEPGARCKEHARRTLSKDERRRSLMPHHFSYSPKQQRRRRRAEEGQQ